MLCKESIGNAPRLCLLLPLSVLQTSYATTVTRPPSKSLQLDVVDNPAARRFEVSLTSLDTRTMCVSVES